MKQLDTTRSRNLGPIVLFEEDLRELFAVLSDEGRKCDVESGDLAFDDVDELLRHFAPRRIKGLKLTTTNPYLTVELTGLWARVYVGSSKPMALGLFHQVIAILQRRSRVISILGSYAFVWLAILVHTATGLADVPTHVRYMLASVYFPYLVWVFFVRLGRHCRIYTQKADSTEAFWQRNRDVIIVNLLTGTVGFLLGVVVQRYVIE